MTQASNDTNFDSTLQVKENKSLPIDKLFFLPNHITMQII